MGYQKLPRMGSWRKERVGFPMLGRENSRLADPFQRRFFNPVFPSSLWQTFME